MFEEMCAVFGTLDIVVANAGLQRQEMTLTQWNTVINVNLTGQFRVIGMPGPRNDLMHRAHADDLAERARHIRPRAPPQELAHGRAGAHRKADVCRVEDEESASPLRRL
jgi:hypothetical protein